MRDVTFSTGSDGEPLVTVTLSAVEVQGIYSALHTRAQEHTERVFNTIREAEDLTGYRGVEAQAESHRTAGEWSLVQEQMDGPFWEWVNGDLSASEVTA